MNTAAFKNYSIYSCSWQKPTFFKRFPLKFRGFAPVVSNNYKTHEIRWTYKMGYRLILIKTLLQYGVQQSRRNARRSAEAIDGGGGKSFNLLWWPTSENTPCRFRARLFICELQISTFTLR
jgi:hypothetical protein